MHGAGIPRPDLDGLHPARAFELHWQDKIPIFIGAIRAQPVSGGRLQHQVRRTELPARGEFWQRSALRYPLLDSPDLLIGETPGVVKITAARFRHPRRHVSALGDRCNLLSVLLYVFVVKEWEGAGLTRAVARRARWVHDRRDVLVEGDDPAPRGPRCRQQRYKRDPTPHSTSAR